MAAIGATVTSLAKSLASMGQTAAQNKITSALTSGQSISNAAKNIITSAYTQAFGGANKSPVTTTTSSGSAPKPLGNSGLTTAPGTQLGNATLMKTTVNPATGLKTVTTSSGGARIAGSPTTPVTTTTQTYSSNGSPLKPNTNNLINNAVNSAMSSINSGVSLFKNTAVTNAQNVNKTPVNISSSRLDTYKPITFNQNGNTILFKPNTDKNGILYNAQGKNDFEKYGITGDQKLALQKYTKNLKSSGKPSAEVIDATKQYLALLQNNNGDAKTFGMHDGSKPETVSTDPTVPKDSITNIVDANKNGIPDNEEDPRALDNNPEDFTNKYNVKVDNLNDVENNLVTYENDITEYEKNLQRETADNMSRVQNENARRILEGNAQRVDEIKGLLQEQISKNKDVYDQSVGQVVSQLGGQFAQFQRMIGQDGKAIDDSTMLALMGQVGVDSMKNIVDLKNNLAQTYINQKEQSQAQINDLYKQNQMTENERDSAIQALNTQAEENVLKLTKNFYGLLFNTVDQANNRKKAEDDMNVQKAQAGALDQQNTVLSYLSSVGLTPEQQNEVFNQYANMKIPKDQILPTIVQDAQEGRNNVNTFISENQTKAQRPALQRLQVPIAKVQSAVASVGGRLRFYDATNGKQPMTESEFNAVQTLLGQLQQPNTNEDIKNISRSVFGKVLSQQEATKVINSL